MAEAFELAAESPCFVYHGSAIAPEAFALPEIDGIQWRPAAELFPRRGRTVAAVLIADASMLQQTSALRDVPSHVVIIAADLASESALEQRANFSVAEFRDAASRGRVLRAACRLACTRLTAMRRRRQLARANRELRELSHIGTALTEVHDRDTLLRRIIVLGKQLTDSDGGVIMLVDGGNGTPPLLRFAVQDFNSLPALELPQITYRIDDTSIIGHAARTKKPVVIDDAYELPADAAFTRNGTFDQRYGYRLRSMLIVPMVDHHGHMVGLLVLVNRVSDPAARITSKAAADQYVLPYTRREVRLARSLAGQAAVSIENAQLYSQIEHIFESFVKAAVTAIDERDPATSGHSVRVAELSVALANAVQRDGRGAFRDLRFTRPQIRELRYAALLHDFGKLTVHEDVLIKAKKLPPVLWERINGRFDLIRCVMELDFLRERVRRPARDGRTMHRREAKLKEDLAELERMRAVVRAANEPEVTAKRADITLRDIANRTFEACDGAMVPYLTADELHYLELPQGTLDDRERAEIESHAEETFRFLDKIPWTEDLKNLPSYAYGHHEKLDGSGYPRHLEGAAIPLQARIITLADIFDALTAWDRPYKPAVSAEHALEIIQGEANAGRLDPELVRVMLASRAYERIINKDWRNF